MEGGLIDSEPSAAQEKGAGASGVDAQRAVCCNLADND